MPISQQEEKLVIAAQHGNVACFEELYTLYYEKIYALALSILKNSADAEDALQMTFINAWKNLSRLDNPSAFSTWLQRIAVNQCNSMLRNRRPAASMDDEGEDGEVMQLESDLMLPHQYAERDDLSRRLQKIISELSDVQRETVMLFYFNDMTIEEIAVIMDCSEGTVKSRLYLARKALKTEIEEQERKTGEKYYGVALIPFGSIFVSQVMRGMISKSAAMNVFRSISTSLFGIPIASQSTPVQGGNSARPASGRVSSAPRHAASSVAKHGTQHAVTSATKASFPIWAKITAGIVTIAVIATGGVLAWNTVRDASKNDQVEPTAVPSVVEQETKSAETILPTDVKQETEAAETIPPTEAPTIVDVDPESMPQSLDAFLIELNYGSTLPGYDVREYDYLDPGETYDTLASVIVGNPSCVDSDIYPGEKTQKLWENNSDPLGKFNNKGGTIIFDETKLLWIMENIFHNSPEKSRDMLDAALEKDEDMYEYEQNGKMYVYKMQLGLGKPAYYITYKQVRFDGERYYFIYDVASGYGSKENAPSMDTKTFYAEMAEEEIDGQSYWTIYRHSSTIPELPAVTGT